MILHSYRACGLRTDKGCGRRTGVTLIEVLMALFIMALGILALLSLFPLAALQMAQSIKDDRTGTLAVNADITFRVFWRKAWQGPNGSLNATTTEPGFTALDNGVATTYTGPSNAVLIDPIGQYASGGSASVAGAITRSNWQAVASSPSPAACVRFCSIMDDMTFNSSSGWADTSNGSIDRGGRYSVAWFIQRPNNSVRGSVNLSVLVYQNRPVTVNPSGEYAVTGSVVPSSVPGVGPTAVNLNLGGLNPNLKKGGWILDVTNTTQPAFYRVVNYNYQTGAVELQLPLQSIASGTATFIIFDNLVEVFNRGTISVNSPPAQQ